MSSAKEDILARIRSSLADAPVAPEPVRNYRRVSELNEEQTIEMLVDRLIDYKANVFHANKENISKVIAERLGEKSTYVVPEGLNMEWLPADTADRKRVTDSGSTLKPGCLSLEELDAVDAVVTGSTVSCAETGTIFLNTNPDEVAAPSPWCPTTTSAWFPVPPWWSWFPSRLSVSPTPAL